jgi:glyceraldehyde 3-phosphate dehydrogenase
MIFLCADGLATAETNVVYKEEKMVKVGISGFGRISRVVIRAALNMDDIEIAGINWRNSDLDYVVYMLKYDSTFGRFPATIEKYDKGIMIDGKKIPVFSEGDAKDIPWGECGAEYIMEGTGAYNTTEKAQAHLNAGAKKVIISAPAKDKVTPTFVYGVNHEEYKKEYDVVSNASCTTNCLAPVCKVINDNWGIDQGLMSTIHAATAKQKVVDARSMKDWRTGRCVFGNIIPTTTGAAKAVALVIPDLKGKLTGIAYRVPTADVSVIDLNLMLKKSATYEEICAKIKEASETYLKGVLEYVDDEVVSSDFIGDPHASIFDAREGIELNDKFFKFINFYDNEFGYSTQILRLIRHMHEVDNK